VQFYHRLELSGFFHVIASLLSESVGGTVEMAYVATTGAAAAAEKRRRLLFAEEEDMTGYTEDDLREEWEFKIVRSGTAAFRKPEVLKKLLEEEARAGWVMLEKFDDSRIRFKRPRSARAKDALLPADVDPYRTQYGALSNQYAVVVGLVMVGLLLLFAAGFGFFVFLSRR
jgi:hypothetical protein